MDFVNFFWQSAPVVPPPVTPAEPPPAAPIEPTLKIAVEQVQQGCGTLWEVTKGHLYKVVYLTGLEEGVKKVHDLVKANSEIIFLGLMVVNVWQNWWLFALGAATGVAVGTGLGERFGLVKESVQILKTPQNLVSYDYLASAFLVVLAPWLCSFQAGVVAVSHLANPVSNAELKEEDTADIPTETNKPVEVAPPVEPASSGFSLFGLLRV